MKYLIMALFLFTLAAPLKAQDTVTSGADSATPVIDKSGDATLKALLGEVVPKFRQLKYKASGQELEYNLFVPENLETGKTYPLVVFMADKSATGENVRAPLTQGYGALVFASAAAQAKNPCYVLVPQFNDAAMTENYQPGKETECLPPLIRTVCEANAIDPARMYITGQGMGGSIAMYLDINNPDIFAASLYVDCHFDSKGLDQLVKKPFIFIYAGEKGKSWPMKDAIETAARKMGISYTWSEWSARLPLQTQDELAATMLAKGQPVNIIGFETGTVLPENSKGSEHMHSFDAAYKLAPPRDWLFGHKLGKSK